MANWKNWLEQIPQDEKTALFEMLSHEMLPQEKKSTEDIIVTRVATEDLFITKTPPFIDIFRLHSVFNALSYRSNVLLKGPKGDGKTLAVLTWAAANKTPVVIQECTEDTRKTDLLGSPSLLGDQTVFVLGSIPAAIDVANEYGRCILLFEELNALTPQAQKMLNAVTDFRKQCSMPTIKRTYRLREGAYLWAVATMNPTVYGGTYDLNEDLKSRFEEINLTYPLPGQEKEIIKLSGIVGAKLPISYTYFEGAIKKESQTLDEHLIDKIIRLAGESRQQATGYALSPRDVIRIVETIPLLGVEKALQLVLHKFEGDDKETMSKRISSIFGGLNIADHWG